MVTEKQKTRRQLIDEGHEAAITGNWADAVTINLQIIERWQRDAEAYNRLGRAHLEQQNYPAANDAYTQALKVDKANLIARRNLQRLDHLRKSSSVSSGAASPRPSVFIEEVGRTWVDELVDPLTIELLAQVSPGERLELSFEQGKILVRTIAGTTLGQIEARTAERIIELHANGNQYEVFALGLSNGSLRVILREVYRDQRNGARVSFTRQVSAARAYLRERDNLRARDESEFTGLDDDDDLEEEGGLLSHDEEDTHETEADPFIDGLQIDEEEPPI
jgi:hypothetical protein